MQEKRERSASMYHIKNLDILNLEPMLQEICEAVKERFGLDVITDAFRPGDDGVHGTTPLRGIDKRCRDKLIGNHVATWVNMRWLYDSERPGKKCCICHDTGKGLHLHLQVHPRSVRVVEKW